VQKTTTDHVKPENDEQDINDEGMNVGVSDAPTLPAFPGTAHVWQCQTAMLDRRRSSFLRYYH